MPTSSTEELAAERWILSSLEGQALLATVARVLEPGPSELVAWRRVANPEQVSAAIRLASSRRRGRAKFAQAERMWLHPVGLEQATPELVARHKARRFAGAGVLDLCSGIGGDTIALAGQAVAVLAVDRDPAMAHRALWNAAAYDVADRVLTLTARAETMAVPEGFRVHVDPDRRAGTATRARRLDDYCPDRTFLLGLTERTRGGAFKLSPASDFATALPADRFEFEVVSLRGECKETTAWFGDLAGCRRRATTLPSEATWTDADGPWLAPAACSEVRSYVFEPDPALGRSDLLDGFARVHGLTRVAADLDLLTADVPVVSPWLTGFAVQSELPADLKRLRRWVAEQGIGPLTIKVRGLDLTPESLRARLRPPGPLPATLWLYGSRSNRTPRVLHVTPLEA